MNIVLQRLTLGPLGPVYGVLLKDNVPLCVTLERPWLDNQIGVSCIIAGTYQVIKNTIAKPWRLLDVPGRTEIDMHAGNSIKDSEGCILVGTSFFPGGIAESQAAVLYLEGMLPNTFWLTIHNP